MLGIRVTRNQLATGAPREDFVSLLLTVTDNQSHWVVSKFSDPFLLMKVIYFIRSNLRKPIQLQSSCSWDNAQ